MKSLVKLVKTYRTEKYYRSLQKGIQVQSTTVKASTRKLKVNWTAELAQDIQAYHTNASIQGTANIIKSEIDKETK